jgi:ATP-dependent DNA helicase RecQ
MEFLIRALDGNPGPMCPPALPPLPTTTDPALVRQAVAFLRQISLLIEPRRQWPAGGMPRYRLSGRIAPNFQAHPGKALCVWGDAGWGGLVRQGKYRDRRFADELVEACIRLVREWNPQPEPAWVTCIPSLRHPDLVPDFGRRLATALNLLFHTVLEKTDDRPEQKTMANSTQQARNIDGSLRVIAGALPTGLVLLVDDMADSRLTVTVSAWLLRSHGSGEVRPLALAQTGYDT